MVEEESRLRELAARVRTADVVDAMGRAHRHRCHLIDLHSPTPDRLLFGPAVTISYMPSCRKALPPERYNFSALFQEAVRDGGRGRVLVLASNGYPDASLGGGGKLSQLTVHGLAGVLTDGRLRDFRQLSEFGFAVYCGGESVRWGGDTITPFEANRPALVSGVAVRPGDYVFADSSGAAVIPAVEVLQILEEADRVVRDEARFAEEVRQEGGSAHEPEE
ncbi:RraA family protein [Streptomyces sp. WMMC940]|uniref:RraA family protein n=1 Tax=Streptomyces sp. WMMC940 TaxID=3015153 RepID=UPI0022B63D3A|nr:RraA family protein [Streptomyces sp. WMMC940]MCZ7456913.1 RraA family protein [Streptomyces sp. WMMC940]